jgi:6-phosphogluconate dehydrogenase
MALIAAASRKYNWKVNLAETARIWKSGCIIRARVLDPIRSAFEREPGLSNLLLDTDLGGAVAGSQTGFSMTLGRAAGWGIPMPAHAASLAYFDSYRSARLPQNLTQAQRDAFGAHRYERIDRPGHHHTEW